MTPHCEQIEAKIAAVIEESADSTTHREVNAHLQVCKRCRNFVLEQRTMRQQLRMLAHKPSSHRPPHHIWEQASAAWDKLDARNPHPHRAPLALVGACLLLMVIGTVWARYRFSQDFPTDAVLRDFYSLESHPLPPRFPTSDPDKASVWLREQLGTELPPLNLSLVAGELQGADVVRLSEMRVGRLLYTIPGETRIAIYVAPNHTRFMQTHRLNIDAHKFQTLSTQDASMFGWESGGVGYGLLSPQPINRASALAINAQHSSAQPGNTNY